MPTPTLITDLSTTAASNFPASSDSPSVLDDVQRAHAAFIAQIRNSVGMATGTLVPATARTSFGAAASGANADITSMVGTATNDNAAAGKIGEYVESIVLFAAPVALTSATTISVTSLFLSAGDWDVSGHVGFIAAATTSVNGIASCLITGSENGGAFYADVPSAARLTYPTAIVLNTGANGTPILTPNTRRLSVNTGTTIYLAAFCNYTISTMSAFGSISARRVR